jgi:hypothetical protein
VICTKRLSVQYLIINKKIKMEVVLFKNYEVGKISMDVKKLKSQMTIAEIKVNNYKELKSTLIFVIVKVLELNPKSRIITNTEAFNLLSELIIERFGKLEIQEIEFALKCGITGVYGSIYNDISIDVVYGWINSYIQNDKIIRNNKSYEEMDEIEKAKYY